GRAGHHLLRGTRGVRGVAGGQRRHVGRDLGPDGQEGDGDRVARLDPGRRGRAVLRLDRRPEPADRRSVVHAALHPAPAAQHVVQGQPDEGGGARGRRAHAAGRPGRGRAREGRRALGPRLRRRRHGDGARRPGRSAPGRRDDGRLRRAELGQPLRDPPPRPDGQEARDARPPDRPVRGDARRGPDAAL
ncbi:MAG: putative periplasmic membrane protein, partial [uncultured Thermoleophilia bacterium]